MPYGIALLKVKLVKSLNLLTICFVLLLTYLVSGWLIKRIYHQWTKSWPPKIIYILLVVD